MDEIKLLRVPNSKEPHLDKSYEFEQIVTNHHRKPKFSLEQLQPWNQEFQHNPFISFKAEKPKKSQSPRLKKQGSLSSTKNQGWKSQQRAIIQRQSKVLPIMDVGELNKIRKSLYPGKVISKLDLHTPTLTVTRSPSKNEIMLPSVSRQLSIERKIFLMKNVSTQQSQSSPSKSHRIRTIIHELRK